MTFETPSYDGPVDPSWPPPHPVEPEPRFDLRGIALDVLVILGGMALLGVLAGVVWALVAEPAALVRFDQSVGQDEVELSREFGATGWYSIIALAAGLLGGLVFGFLRQRDHVATLLLLLAGCVAAALLMHLTGHLLGPDDPSAILEKAPVGTRADGPLTLSGVAPYLGWPIGALAGVLVALLSRTD